MSLSEHESLGVGDGVMVVDDEAGAVTWMTVTRLGRELENPGSVKMELDTVPTRYNDYVARAVEAVGSPSDPQKTPGVDDADAGGIMIADPTEPTGTRWVPPDEAIGGDPSLLHAHPNKPALDELPDPSASTPGWVVVVDGSLGYTLAEIEAGSDHTHTNKVTLDAIADVAAATEGHSLQATVSGTEWAARFPAGWADETDPTKLNGQEIKLGSYQHSWLGRVTADETAGGPQQLYEVEILSPIDKSPTSQIVSGCYVVDDTQDIFEIGTKVTIVNQSADDVAAGSHPLITGVIDRIETAPPHSHSARAFGYMVWFAD